jgi:hypothetical protein
MRLRTRSLLHLRVQRAGGLPDLFVPTVILLAPEDADALADESPAVVADVAALLARHAPDLLPDVLPPGAVGGGGGVALVGGARGGMPTGAAAAAAAAAAGGEVTAAGDVAIVAFSVRRMEYSYPVLTLSSVGGSVETASATTAAVAAGEYAPPAGGPAFSGGPTALACVTARVTHKARQHDRTEAALMADAGKMHRYVVKGGGGGAGGDAAGGGGGAGGGGPSRGASPAPAAPALPLPAALGSAEERLATFMAMKPKRKGGKK